MCDVTKRNVLSLRKFSYFSFSTDKGYTLLLHKININFIICSIFIFVNIEVLMVASIKIIVFWDVMLCCSLDRLLYTKLHNITLQKTVILNFLFKFVIRIAQTKHCS
jgi:hypothetical protein